MRVRFSITVLHDPTAFFSLDRIVDLFLEERHIWVIEDPDEIRHSAWIANEELSRTAQRNLEALEKCFTTAIYGPPAGARGREVEIVGRPAGTAALSAAEARRMLEAPAYVIVEDADSDGAFLEAMAAAFGREALARALDAQWCQIVHAGGGGGVKKRLDEVLKRHPFAGRVYLLFDSDRLTPEQDAKPRKVLAECMVQHGVRGFVLSKREIENYLPALALQQWRRKDKAAVCKAFLYHLDDSQRDHYDMKKGFDSDPAGDAVLGPQSALYQHVPRRVLRDLCGGFGRDVWTLFRDKRSLITAEGVRSTCRTDPDELPRLLDELEELL